MSNKRRSYKKSRKRSRLFYKSQKPSKSTPPVANLSVEEPLLDSAPFEVPNDPKKDLELLASVKSELDVLTENLRRYSVYKDDYSALLERCAVAERTETELRKRCSSLQVKLANAIEEKNLAKKRQEELFRDLKAAHAETSSIRDRLANAESQLLAAKKNYQSALERLSSLESATKSFFTAVGGKNALSTLNSQKIPTLEDFTFSPETKEALKKSRISTLDVLLRNTTGSLHRIGLSSKAISEIEKRLQDYGLTLA